MRGAVAFLVILGACGGGEPDAGPDAGGEPDAEVDQDDPADALFAPDHVVEVSITVDEADWDALRYQTRTISSVIEGDCLGGPVVSPFTTFEAEVTIDGTTIDRVGIKKKGFFGSLDTDKPSLKLKLDELLDGYEYLGLEKLTLNNANQDPSLVRQCLAYPTFAAAGIVVPRCNFAHVEVNGVDLGIYVHVESIDHQLTKRRYAAGKGDLFEGSLSDFRTDWVDTFDIKGDGDVAVMQPLVDVLETASDADLLDALAPILDVDQFLTYWAMEMVLNHWDGYANDKNNFFVYADPTSGQLQFIPWGVDATFQPGITMGGIGVTGGPVAVAAAGILTHRLWNLPETRDAFLARQRELLDEVWDEDALLDELDRMEELITPRADAYQGAGWHADVDDVRDFVTGRRAALTAAIDAGPVWDRPLDGYPCLDIIAQIDATFTATYGTLGNADPLGTGDGTMSITIDGTTTTLTPVGASAGLDPDPAPGSPATSLIQLFGYRASDGHILVAMLSINPWTLFPRNVDLGFFDGFGQVFDYDPATDTASVVGFLLGTAQLTAASPINGATIAGSFHANADRQGTMPPANFQRIFDRGLVNAAALHERIRVRDAQAAH